MAEFTVNIFNKNDTIVLDSPSYDTEFYTIVDAVIETIRYHQSCDGLMFLGDTIKIVEVTK
jgi:hypothetical protein